MYVVFPDSTHILQQTNFDSGGHAADRIGRLNFLYPMILLCGLLCVAMWLPATTPGVLAGFACLYGFASGVFISVMPAATGQIIPADKLGARLGAFGTVTSMAFLTGSPIAGALITSETRAGYHSLIIFAVSLAFARLIDQKSFANGTFLGVLSARRRSRHLRCSTPARQKPQKQMVNLQVCEELESLFTW